MSEQGQYQKRFLKLIPREEALRRVLNALELKPIGYESIAVEESLGRILAEDIISDRDIPPYNQASMDGYAVRSSDVAEASFEKPSRLKVLTKLFPSSFHMAGVLNEGEAMYVASGAPLPLGADAVVRVENAKVIDEWIEVYEPIEPWRNVTRIGQDVRKGEVVLKKGHVLTPRDIGVLTMLGVKKVLVVRKLKVAIISVGDELTESWQGDPGKVVISNTYMVSQMISDFGAIPIVMGVVPDNPEEIAKKIIEALKGADIVLTIGGCSIGLNDFVPDAINSIGKPGIVFHGITTAPGRVSGVGVISNKPVVMVPGYAVSALACFYFFVIPLLNGLSGLDPYGSPPVLEARLLDDVIAKPGLDLFLLLRISFNKGYEAEPIYGPSSSANDLARANGYTIVRAGSKLMKGETIRAYLFSFSELRNLNFRL
ncbi:MAG: molybdopterin molybdotransferase MoeA [Nitrososphaerota archaeon]|nr:molybdopterin molybdotransferase MoeA [Nitrososphaerales archaeon]MDW8045007.1 molybdopterin molybdotransferase MoeA [Nitrososphaerota archaeon]